eukprot:TRINITY_DN27422_c0_g1_i1.p1 TRINITY_DN27422_c0_g1~~TRINITY_DN27422_c0_g1_i1.p1  ORF type:complete len:367 (-),score=10.51 TRINITY_DN27422_c0_g1_i1:29-1018(-)
MSTTPTYNQDSNGFLMKSFGNNIHAPSGIVGLWSFDTADGADSSNNVNGFSSPVPPLGVGILRGSSGLFTGVTTYSVPHIDAYSQYAEGTISAWIYLLSEVEDNFRVIIKKGDGKDFDAFELKVWPTTRLLRASAGSLSVNTEASLPLTKWTHVAVRVAPTSLEVYMNGVLAGATKIPSVQASVSPLQMNKHPIYVASTQDMSTLGVHAYIDNLKWTKGLLSLAELRAEAALASWGIPGGMEMAWLGCDECTRAEAMDICDQKHVTMEADSLAHNPSHLCSEMELSAGALTVARSMGWLSLSAKLPIFTLDNSKVGASAIGVGLCCLNE